MRPLRTIAFTTLLCACCAGWLTWITTTLRPLQEQARALYQQEQMLIAAGWLLQKGEWNPQAPIEAIKVWRHKTEKLPYPQQVQHLFATHIETLSVTPQGHLTTPNTDQPRLYRLSTKKQTLGYLIPLEGQGLWGPIKGFLGLAADGATITGSTWHTHKETPGLGAKIEERSWQEQFIGKQIWIHDGTEQPRSSMPLGIVIVQGSAAQQLGDSPLYASAVDGITGATLTMRGVEETYRHTLNKYRTFLQNQHKEIQ